MWDLIVSIPDHCLSFYFTLCSFTKLVETSAKLSLVQILSN